MLCFTSSYWLQHKIKMFQSFVCRDHYKYPAEVAAVCCFVTLIHTRSNNIYFFYFIKIIGLSKIALRCFSGITVFVSEP